MVAKMIAKKAWLLLMVVVSFAPLIINAQQELALTENVTTNQAICGPRIGDKAPAFTADSTEGIVNFPQDYEDKWVILFSHPADFTPVCETEFKKFASLIPEFKKLNTQLVGISVDSKYTHKEWMKKIDKDREIDFPVLADPDMKIVTLYGMIHPNESEKQTIRSVYFIDPDKKIRALLYYPIANGRSFDEIMRLLQAMQTVDKDPNAITPADWQPGDKVLDKKIDTQEREKLNL